MFRVIQSSTQQYKFDPYRFSWDLVNGLEDALPPRSSEIKQNSEYNEIQIFSKYRKQKIRALVLNILKENQFETFVPYKSKPYDIQVIKGETFISLYIDDGFVNDHNTYDVYIHIDYHNSNIIFEKWYKNYEKSKDITSASEIPNLDPESKQNRMYDLSGKLKNYLASFYQVEPISRYCIYVIPRNIDQDSLDDFAEEILDFIDGFIIDVEGPEGHPDKWILMSREGVPVTVKLAGKSNPEFNPNGWIVEVAYSN